MKFLLKLEHYANELLIKIIDAVSPHLVKKIPKFPKVQMPKISIELKKPKVLEDTLSSITTLSGNIKKDPKNFFLKFFLEIKDISIKQFKASLITLRKNKKLIIVYILLFSCCIYLINILHSLYQRLYPSVEVNEVIEYKSERPSYYKKTSRYILFSQVNIPIYLSKNNKIRSISVDLIIETSNRLTGVLFRENAHQIRDFLNSNMAPITALFPLEEEGKRIIRRKIKKELNRYIKFKKINGRIQSIYIQGILID